MSQKPGELVGHLRGSNFTQASGKTDTRLRSRRFLLRNGEDSITGLGPLGAGHLYGARTRDTNMVFPNLLRYFPLNLYKASHYLGLDIYYHLTHYFPTDRSIHPVLESLHYNLFGIIFIICKKNCRKEKKGKNAHQI